MKNFKHPNNQGFENNFDFADKASPEHALTTIETFAEQKKTEIKGKIFRNKFRQNNKALWILTLVVIALAGLCAFTTYQIYRLENGNVSNTLALQNNSNSDPKNKTNNNSKATSVVWSGEGFVLSSAIMPVPSGFTREITEVKSDFFDNQSTELNTFLSTDTISGDEFQSGIAIYRMKYDSKLDQQKFTQKILEQYNTEYISSGQQITLPGDFVSTKIVPTNKNSYTALYPVVSTNNYYVIKILTQGKDERSLDAKTKFTEQLIGNLALK